MFIFVFFQVLVWFFGCCILKKSPTLQWNIHGKSRNSLSTETVKQFPKTVLKITKISSRGTQKLNQMLLLFGMWLKFSFNFSLFVPEWNWIFAIDSNFSFLSVQMLACRSQSTTDYAGSLWHSRTNDQEFQKQVNEEEWREMELHLKTFLVPLLCKDSYWINSENTNQNCPCSHHNNTSQWV